MYPDQQSTSAQLYRRASRVMPGGNSRVTVFQSPYPLYAEYGRGVEVIDVDGVARLDFVNNYTALIHGHAYPAVVRAAIEQIHRGSAFGAPTEAEVGLAELLASRVPSLEQVRFTNSGTEAVMMAVRAARAFTGRTKIAKVEGSYHGSYDVAEVSLDPSPANWGDDEPRAVAYSAGTPDAELDQVVVIPFNDVARAKRILERHAADLAAVLVDPLPTRVGLIPASRDYLVMLREFTRRHGSLLIFDEVISFRLGYHGAQGEAGVDPDLTTLGKIIGGGFPVGAVGGKAEIMKVFDPRGGKPRVPHGGTFNANPVSMSAGLAAMESMTPSTYEDLSALGEQAREAMNQAFAIADVPGQVTGVASLFRVHMKSGPITDYRSAFAEAGEKQALEVVHRYLQNHGVLIASYGLGCLSTPMDSSHIDILSDVLLQGLREVHAALQPL
jgi:glutamate-1-semialdehyde 2,1-aminomutase